MSKPHKTGLVPALRFPEFQNKLEWKKTKLGDVCDMQAGKFMPASEIKDEKANGLYPCYGGNGLRGFTKTFTHNGKYSLIGRQGALCGNITLATEQFHATEHAVVVTPDKRVSTLWLYYMLIYLNLNQFATGQAQPGLSVENLEKVSLSISPEENEQQKIADCLASLDDLITAETQKLAALKTHKKGLMQQLFPAEGETVPRLRFLEFREAGEWTYDVLDKLVDVVDGDRGVNYPKAEEFSQLGFCLFLTAKNVTKYGFKFDEFQFITEEKDKLLRKGKLQRKDVVLTTRGSVGQFAYFTEDVPYENMRINSGMVILRIKSKKIIPDYLYAFIKSESLVLHIENVAFGNAQQQLTVAGIKKFPIYYPLPEEQQKIADCLSSVDALITAQGEKIEALKLHKKGLMQQLFPVMEAVDA